MRRALFSWALMMWMGLLPGCGDGASSPRLFVSLQTDYLGVSELREVRVVVDGMHTQVHRPSETDYLGGRRVATFVTLREGTHRVRVVLFDGAQEQLGVREAQVNLRGDQNVAVLIARRCRNISCPAELQCSGDRCVALACGQDTPEQCEGGCTQDIDCVSPCAPGFCTREGACLFRAVEGSCPAGTVCSTNDRCEPLMTPPDGGVDSGLDGAPTDNGLVDGGLLDSSTRDAEMHSDSGSMEDAGTDAGVPCPPAQEVGTLSELLAHLPEAYPPVRPASGRGNSGDLQATRTFNIFAVDIPIPSDCEAPCQVFLQHDGTPGLERLSGGVRIAAGTLFRIRAGQALHPGVGPSAEVQLTAPCTTRCGDETLLCEADYSCMAPHGPTFCLECNGEAPSVCACIADDLTAQPDGARCSFQLDGAGYAGNCRDGRCETGRSR